MMAFIAYQNSTRKLLAISYKSGKRKLFSCCLLPAVVRLVNRRGVQSMVHMVHGLVHGIIIIGWLTCNQSTGLRQHPTSAYKSTTDDLFQPGQPGQVRMKE